MNRSMIVHSVSIIILLGFLTSCASSPASPDNPGESYVDLTILDKHRIGSRFGTNYAMNPYMAPSDMLIKKTKEFIVLELAITSDVPVNIEYGRVKAVSDQGTNLARFMDKPAMVEYWRDMGTLEEFDKQTEVLERTYLPFLSFERKAGRRSYIMVLIGERPIPRPFNVEASFYVNGKAFEFSIPVTE